MCAFVFVHAHACVCYAALNVLHFQIAAISKLKTELQQIDSSKWESCLKLWNILRADDEKQTFTASKNDNNDIGHDVALDIPSESALKCSRKRKHAEMTFRVSAKCSGELRFWFDSQVAIEILRCDGYDNASFADLISEGASGTVAPGADQMGFPKLTRQPYFSS